MKKKIFILMSLIVACLFLTGCNFEKIDNNLNNDTMSGDYTSIESTSGETESGDTKVTLNRDAKRYASVSQNPVATIEMEDGKIIKVELYPQIAPETVENFIELANNGFYNGLTFHRTIPGFMAQGGDPAGNGTGGPDYAIFGEFSQNGFENSLKHERGVISMARSEAVNTAGSQFFIMVENDERLDGAYASFGKVLEGMDVVDEIVNVEVVRRTLDETIETFEEYYKQFMELDRPVNPPKIKTITVDTFDVTYEAPTKLSLEEMMQQ